ncbi:S26 family signal peptidase [Streptomyces sp. CC208A]|uniref:S26 family signal peptidase n=1 Tax=Streptomyces sp. CC208A TaxID=3044573 RepID=UPI0024A8E4E2|nr:S26 family signal peptidase [Streptomyces sp. CC208A]
MTYVVRTAAAAVAAGAGAVVAVRAVRSRFALVRVTGSSMAPTYRDGERLLVRRRAPIRSGDAVVFRNPVPGADTDVRWLVKRVTAMPGAPVPDDVRPAVDTTHVPRDCLVVRGDGARTQDSRHFGYVPVASVLGVVVARGRPREPVAGRAIGPAPL